MSRKALSTVLVVALVALAGCTGAGVGGSPTAGAGSPGGDGAGTNTGSTGSISFYISDRPNAIDDFAHLNVTITKVGLHRTGDGDADNATATPANGTTTVTATATPASETPTATGTPAGTADGADTEDERDEKTEDERDEKENDKDDGEADDSDGKWVEYEVNKTVDLTKLVGDNATRLDVLKAPAGSYDKVFIYVSDINATLKNGESVNVKLPSQKLQLNKQFEVGDGSNVSFVFDIAVHKAGKSGKYILRPVVSQSGTDVPIDDVDEKRDDKGDDEGKDEGEKGEKGKDNGKDEGERDDDANETDGDDAPSELDATFVGRVAAGENVTLRVTSADGPVANATVEVNGEVLGTTGADGTFTFRVPKDAEELTVTVTKGDAEVELERELGGGN